MQALAVVMVVVLTAACATGSAQPQRSGVRIAVPPYDDACTSSALCEARKEISKIVESRDVSALMGYVSAEFNVGAGGAGTRRDFEDVLRDRRSPTWTQLRKVLALGGSMTQSSFGPAFCGPYPYTRAPSAEALLEEAGTGDGGVAISVISPSANIYEGTDAKSRVLATVGYEMVAGQESTSYRWYDPDAADAWALVYWAGVTGHMQWRDLWSQSEPHLCMKNEGARWVIREFFDQDGRVG